MGESRPLVGMRKRTVAEDLLEITNEYSDRRVALMLAEQCLSMTDKPFRFAINHDIRPPKNLACPMHYDWTRKDRVGVEINDKETARRWLVSAARLGYTLYLMKADRTIDGRSWDVERARRNAAWHQRPQVEKDHDDDIPF